MNPRIETRPYAAIACGGTGGHLFPGLAVGQKLVALGCDVVLLVSPKDVDQQAVKSAHGMEVFTLPAVAFQNGNRLQFLMGFWNSFRAVRKLFKRRRPDAVLAMGGFTSAPPVLAGRIRGVKTFLHESNTIPGRANRWLARIVSCAFVGFEQTGPLLAVRKVFVTGTPVRSHYQPQDVRACCQALGLDPMKPVVLVTGGSQGARGVNDMILTALPLLAQRGPHWQWIHLTGPDDTQRVAAAYDKLGIRAIVQPYMEQLAVAMGAATACVSRAGASSLAEIAAMRLPALLVPFPHSADNHQFYNAQAFAKSGAARLLEQHEGSPEILTSIILDLLENNAGRCAMQAALDQRHVPNAAHEIAGLMMKAIGEGRLMSAGGNRQHSKYEDANCNTVKARLVTKNHATQRGGIGLMIMGLVWKLLFGLDCFRFT